MTTRKQLIGQIQRPGQKPENITFIASERPDLTSAERAAGLEWVNQLYAVGDVRRYGATGDGVTDDRQAFVDAFAQAEQSDGISEVLVPPGTYVISSTVSIPDDVIIKGQGKLQSKISFNGSGAAMSRVFVTKASANVMNIVVRDLGFVGGNTAAGALLFDRGDHVVIDGCDFRDFTASGAYGINLINVYHWQVTRCKFENIAGYGVICNDVSTVGCNQGIVGPLCDFIGNNQASFIGVYLDYGQEISIKDNDFEGSNNGDIAIKLEGVEGVNISDNYIELWDGGCVIANSGAASKRVTVSNNVLNRSTTGAVCDFDNSNTNDNIVVFQNRFADMVATNDCIDFGSTTRAVEFNNDPDVGDQTDTYLQSTEMVRVIKGSKTWDPANIVDTGTENTTVTVTGAAIGDYAMANFSNHVGQTIFLTAHVSAADTVRVQLYNREGAAVNMASGTLKAIVFKGL